MKSVVLLVVGCAALVTRRETRLKMRALKASDTSLTIASGIMTDSSREKDRIKSEEASEKAADERISPAEEESELVIKIAGSPKLGVSGLFDEVSSNLIV